MYSIETNKDHLLVKFEEDFDYPMILAIIKHETLLPEYSGTNDIWLIGSHKSRISYCDLDTMATEFRCMCPRDATRAKTAIVVDESLTKAIIELWVGMVRKRIPFEIELFETPEAAERWLGIAGTKVA